MRVTQPRISSKIKSFVRDIPPLSQVWHRINELNDTRINMLEMLRIIESDDILPERLMALVNSGYYGLPERMDSLKDALSMMGHETVRNVVLNVTLFDSLFSERSRSPLNPARFKEHSLGCGIACRALADQIGMFPEKAEMLFIAGMLHDLGKIVLLNIDEVNYGKALMESRSVGVSLYFAEMAHFGCSHTHAGTLLARHWKLHSFFENIIQYHHSTSDLKRNLMKNLVVIANNISKRAFPGASGNDIVEEAHLGLMRQVGIDPAMADKLIEELPGRVRALPPL